MIASTPRRRPNIESSLRFVWIVGYSWKRRGTRLTLPLRDVWFVRVLWNDEDSFLVGKRKERDKERERGDLRTNMGLKGEHLGLTEKERETEREGERGYVREET